VCRSSSVLRALTLSLSLTCALSQLPAHSPLSPLFRRATPLVVPRPPEHVPPVRTRPGTHVRAYAHGCEVSPVTRRRTRDRVLSLSFLPVSRSDAPHESHATIGTYPRRTRGETAKRRVLSRARTPHAAASPRCETRCDPPRRSFHLPREISRDYVRFERSETRRDLPSRFLPPLSLSLAHRLSVSRPVSVSPTLFVSFSIYLRTKRLFCRTPQPDRSTDYAIARIRVTARSTHGDFNTRDDTCVPEYLAMTRCHFIGGTLTRWRWRKPYCDHCPCRRGSANRRRDGGRERSPIGRAHLATWATSAGGHARHGPVLPFHAIHAR